MLAVYLEIDLEKVFTEYEGSAVAQLNEMIAAIDQSQGLKREVFAIYLQKIHKRVK